MHGRLRRRLDLSIRRHVEILVSLYLVSGVDFSGRDLLVGDLPSSFLLSLALLFFVSFIPLPSKILFLFISLSLCVQAARTLDLLDSCSDEKDRYVDEKQHYGSAGDLAICFLLAHRQSKHACR